MPYLISTMESPSLWTTATLRPPAGNMFHRPRNEMKHQRAKNPIESAVRGVGVNWVRSVDTYDMKGTMAAFKDALTTDYDGPKVIIAEGECQLNRQRRLRPRIKALLETRQTDHSGALRRRRKRLYRRSFVYSSFGLSLSNHQAQSGSPTPAPCGTCGSKLCGVRCLRERCTCRDPVSVVLPHRCGRQSKRLRSDARSVSIDRDWLAEPPEIPQCLVQTSSSGIDH